MKYLSLFSGIGGFELGLQNSFKDFECIGYAEIDKYAKNIYENHFNHKDLGDVTLINPNDLEDFDLLVGGFPCQAFSVAGNQRGFDDTRGTLFFEIERILKIKKPKYFLLENVRNLLSHDKGRTFQIMMQILINLGYNIRWDVLNSKDFGVPQSRERIYIRGSLRDFPNDISIRDNGLGQPNRIKCLVRGKYQHEKILLPEGLNQTLAAAGGNSGGSTVIRESKIKKIGNHSRSGKGQGGNVYDENGLSPTLTCQHDYPAKVRVKKVYGSMQAHRAETDGTYSPTLTAISSSITNRPILETEYTYRSITPIEAERLQGFPDDWTKEGEDGTKISNTQRYKCCGNAVTTNVIKYIIDNWNI
ncbi:MAG: DNA cytosine methyltransferase [Bacilli bacterium]|nr:DNA cytosine methyltransferase [Bacilli bacterium]